MSESVAPAGSPPTPPVRRRLSLLVRAALVGLVAVFALGLLAFASLQSPLVGTRVANLLLRALPLAPGVEAVVGDVRGNWITDLELRRLRMARGDTLLASVTSIRLRLEPWRLMGGRLEIERLAFDEVALSPDVSSAFRSKPGGPRRTLADYLRGRFYGGPPIHVARIDVRGSSYGETGAAPAPGAIPAPADSALSPTFAAVSIAARDLRLGRDFGFVVDSLTLHYEPRPGAVRGIEARLAAALSDGRLQVRDATFLGPGSAVAARAAIALDDGDSVRNVEVELHATPLSLADVSLLAPRARLEGDLTADVSIRGARIDRLTGSLRLALGASRFGTLGFEPSRLDAAVADGRADVVAVVAHEGARADVKGWIRPLDATPRYEFAVRADRLPRRLPNVPWWGEMAARGALVSRWHVVGQGYADASGRFEVEASDGGGRLSAAGSVKSRPAFEWELNRIELERFDVARWAGAPAASEVTGTLRANGRRGREGLQRVTATWTLGECRYDRWSIRSSSGELALDGEEARAALRVDSEYGEAIAADMTARLGNRAEFHASALRLSALDLAALTGRDGLPRRLDATIGLDARRSGDVWNVEATANTNAGRIVANAAATLLEARTNVTIREARFAELDLGPWTGGGLPTRLNGTASGEFSRAGAPTWSGVVRLEPSRVGAWALTAGSLDASATRDSLRATARLGTRGGDVVAGAAAALGANPQGRVRLDVPFAVLTALAGRDTLPAGGGVRFTADFQGLDARSATAVARWGGEGTVGGVDVDSIYGTARLGDGVVTVDTMAVRSRAALAGGSGRIVLADSSGRRASDFTLRATGADLASLRSLVGADTLSAAEARFVARLAGPVSDRTIELAGSLRSLVWDGLRLREAGAEAKGSLRVGGEWRVAADASLDASHRARLEGVAVRDSAEIRARLDTITVQVDSTRWGLTRPASIRLGRGRLAVDSLELAGARGALRVGGVLDRRGEENMTLELEDAGLAPLARFAGRRDLGGRIDGRIAITGPAAAPCLEGFLRVAPTIAGASAGVADARLSCERGLARLRASLVAPAGDSLAVVGKVPISISLAAADSNEAPKAIHVGTGEVDIHARANQFPIASLEPFLPAAVVSSLAGRLDMDLRLAGAGDALRGEGRLAIEGGALTLPAIGGAYRDAGVEARFSGDRLRLTRAQVASNEGTLDVGGDIRFASLTRVEPNLVLTSKNFQFMNAPDLRLRGTGEIRIGGAVNAPKITGTMNMNGCIYVVTEATVAGAQQEAEVKLTEADIRMLEETFGVQDESANERMLALYDASDLDLDVTLERDNWVQMRSAPRMAVELGGRVRAKKAPHGEIDLRGQLKPLPKHGYIQQFGRTFDVTGGDILLNGPMESHKAELNTEYEIPSEKESDYEDVKVHLDLKMDAEKMALKLSSEPQMSETEIVNYITTGQRSKGGAGMGSAASSSASALAADIGMSMVTGALGDVAQQKIGLDVFRVRYDPQLGATVVAGQYVGSKVFVGIRQPVQYRVTTDQESQNPYQTAAEVEYEAAPWLVMNVQGELSEFRAFLRARHGY